MNDIRALPLPRRWFLLAATIAPAAAKAGKDENEPHKIAAVHRVHTRAAAAVEQHQKQHDVTGVATASVCAVCKESVHFMYPLLIFRIAPTLPYAFLKNCVTTHWNAACKIYFDVRYLKRMIGITVALFCTLIVSGLCSLCFKFDLKWWIALDKPLFVASRLGYTLMVAGCYLSCVLAVSRLVEFKHIFPSMLFFVFLGLFSVLFVFAFFTLKNFVFALVCITAVLAMAYVLFIRFLTKDWKIALEFLPTFVFDIYAFLCVLYIFMNNWRARFLLYFQRRRFVWAFSSFCW